jgi:hypothetical protein
VDDGRETHGVHSALYQDAPRQHGMGQAWSSFACFHRPRCAGRRFAVVLRGIMAEVLGDSQMGGHHAAPG